MFYVEFYVEKSNSKNQISFSKYKTPVISFAKMYFSFFSQPNYGLNYGLAIFHLKSLNYLQILRKFLIAGTTEV
jgi:hypothetical protein